MRYFAAILLSMCAGTVFAQKDYTFVYNSDSIMRKGITLHDAGEYANAIKEYEKIVKLDAKYPTAQYEKALALAQSDKGEDEKAVLETLYRDGYFPENPDLYVLYGSYLSDAKAYTESEKIFLEGAKITPHFSRLLYNQALLYVRMDKQQEAVDILQNIIEHDPLYASPHYMLGVLALENGRPTEATLSLLTYLMISPTGQNAAKAIGFLDKKLSENFLEKGKVVFSKTGDNFGEIETILQNGLPLRSAFKVKSDFDEKITRQVQAVCEFMASQPAGDGFYERTYGPWIKKAMDTNQFEPMSYYMLLVLEDELGKKLKSQEKKIINFAKKNLSDDLVPLMTTVTTDFYGTRQAVRYVYEDGHPIFAGTTKDGKLDGKVMAFNAFGGKSGDLNFKAGDFEGLQRYYDFKGRITVEKNMKDGKATGKWTNYYDNGEVSLTQEMKDDKRHGALTSFLPNGGKQCEGNFVDGNREGVVTCYYADGTVESKASYKKDMRDGPFTSYNELGDIKIATSFIEDEYDGKYVSYYDGKAIESEAVYAKGKVQGELKSYYENGKVKAITTYVNGNPSKSESYDPNGALSQTTAFNDKGETQVVTYYDDHGERYFDHNFKSDDLKAGVQYARNNPKPVPVSLSKKPFIIKDLDGHVLTKGEYEKGMRTKTWEYTDRFGNLVSKIPYKDGDIDGVLYFYNDNGSLASIEARDKDEVSGVDEGYNYGVLSSVEHYEAGKTNGPAIFYNADGSVRRERFDEGGETLRDIEYWSTGKMRENDYLIEDEVYKREIFSPSGEKVTTIDFRKMNGKFSYRYTPKSEGYDMTLVNGNFHGPFKITQPDGSVIVDAQFRNGRLHGIYKRNGPANVPLNEYNYYNGLLHGEVRMYDLNGALRTIHHYAFGKAYGLVQRFYLNKNKVFEYTEFDGKQTGEITYYNQKGEPILKVYDTNDHPEYYIRFGKSGQLDEKVVIKDGTADILSVYPNGKTAASFRFVRGMIDGKYALYNADGKPALEADYKMGLYEGKRTEYHENGKPARIERFVNGDLDGLYESFGEDGKLRLQASYKNDNLEGDVLIYTNGVITKTKKYDSGFLVEVK